MKKNSKKQIESVVSEETTRRVSGGRSGRIEISTDKQETLSDVLRNFKDVTSSKLKLVEEMILNRYKKQLLNVLGSENNNVVPAGVFRKAMEYSDGFKYVYSTTLSDKYPLEGSTVLNDVRWYKRPASSSVSDFAASISSSIAFTRSYIAVKNESEKTKKVLDNERRNKAVAAVSVFLEFGTTSATEIYNKLETTMPCALSYEEIVLLGAEDDK